MASGEQTQGGRFQLRCQMSFWFTFGDTFEVHFVHTLCPISRLDMMSPAVDCMLHYK